MTSTPVWSALTTQYLATVPTPSPTTIANFQTNYPTAVQNFAQWKQHRYLTLVSINTAGTLPNGQQVAWWDSISDLRVNNQVITYDVTINFQTQQIAVYRLDAQLNDVGGYSANPNYASHFAAYLASGCIFSGSVINGTSVSTVTNVTAIPSGTTTTSTQTNTYADAQTARLMLLQQAFDAIINEMDSDEMGIQYFGHGNGQGGFLASKSSGIWLNHASAVNSFFQHVTTKASLPNGRFLFGHFGTNCSEGTDLVLHTRGAYFQYLTLTSNTWGLTFPNANQADPGYRLLNYWGQSQFPTSINPYLWATPATIAGSLTYILDIYNNAWNLGWASAVVQLAQVQNMTLFNAGQWSNVQNAVRTSPGVAPLVSALSSSSSSSGAADSSATTLQTNVDLLLLMQQVQAVTATVNSSLWSQFQVYSVSTQNLVSWGFVDNGLRVLNVANLLGYIGDMTNPSAVPLTVPGGSGCAKLGNGSAPQEGYLFNWVNSTPVAAAAFVATRTQSDQPRVVWHTLVVAPQTSWTDTTATVSGVTYQYVVYGVDSRWNASFGSVPTSATVS